jgi:hypothetical protein
VIVPVHNNTPITCAKGIPAGHTLKTILISWGSGTGDHVTKQLSGQLLRHVINPLADDH